MSPIDTQVTTALIASADAHRCAVWIEKSDMARWASCNFAGARIAVTLMAEPSANFDCWLAMLPEAEFSLAGNTVADLVVGKVTRDAASVSADLEILTVQEPGA